MWRRSVTFGSLMALAACGSPNATFTRNEKGETTVTTAGGPGGTIVTNVASSLTPIPTDLPRWTPAYPGAKVAQVSNIALPGGSQKVVVLMTADARPKVMAFYDQKIAALGIKPMLSAEEADGSMRSVGAPGSQPESLTVGPAEGQTAISISYRAKP